MRIRQILFARPQPTKGDEMQTKASSSSGARKHICPAVLPETGYLRLPQIIGDAKAAPPVPALIPIGKSSWWAGVKAGKYPQSVKLGPRTTAWRVEDILTLISHTSAGGVTSDRGSKALQSDGDAS